MKTQLGHYDIVAELGRGGMGVVYKGYEASLNRYVAIKVLADALAHDEAVKERFLREARSMAVLNDPHIIQIYFIGDDAGQRGGGLFAMRLRPFGRIDGVQPHANLAAGEHHVEGITIDNLDYLCCQHRRGGTARRNLRVECFVLDSLDLSRRNGCRGVVGRVRVWQQQCQSGQQCQCGDQCQSGRPS